MPGPAAVDDPAALTPEWLTAALRSTGHQLEVRGVQYEQIGTGQIGASYRLHLDVASGGPVPATLVAKLAAGDEAARERVKQGFLKEVRFDQSLAGLTRVRTPRCWFADISADLRTFTLLLDDLAPGVPGRQADGCSLAQARAAVENLAALHAPPWNAADILAEHADWLIPMDAATGAFLGDLMTTATDEFVARYRADLTTQDADTLRAAAALVGRWAGMETGTLSVLHGDYRLDNLMFAPDTAAVTAIDWQTATTGPPARDLAYFLQTSLHTQERQAHERDLLTRYAGSLRSHGVGYSVERAYEDYRLGMLQGPLITVLGCIYATAAPSPAADEMFLAMATRSCAAIRDVRALEAVQELV